MLVGHILLSVCLSRAHSVECVFKTKSILSIIFRAIYGAVRITPTHFSYDDYEKMCTYLIIIIKLEVWPIL